MKDDIFEAYSPTTARLFRFHDKREAAFTDSRYQCSDNLLAAMRYGFGGHAVKKEGKKW